jgi:hypothetical protein
MKQILIILTVLFSGQAFSQVEESLIKGNIQEGEIYYFDMNKHICGQKYYIKTGNDTILVNRNLMDLKIDSRKLPIKVYLTISGDVVSSSCSGNYKTLSYIKRK